MKRRNFIQFASSALATVGISQLDIMQQGDKYAKTLAQNTGRKLALLVGINQYNNGLSPLEGCVNDVRLQKQLLTYRFGFNPKDILTLTDTQATRQGILTAFEEHLIKQAKPGDVVVFHFSGHGSQVADPDKDTPDGLNGTLVPIDAGFPAGYPSQGGKVQDIMGHTLFLLMYALKTDNVTVVLDSCHSGGAKRGNFAVRSRSGGKQLQVSPNELEYQRQWLKRLNLSHEDFIRLRRKGVAKGVVIASAKREQLALDASFDDFSAGAFTYLFTQYLWQQPKNQSVKRILVDVSRSTNIYSDRKGYSQIPELELNVKQPNPSLYFTPFKTNYAEAVITEVNGNKVELWLGGVDSQSLGAFEKDAIFTVADGKGKGLVKLESRQGLVGKGTLIDTPQLQTGTLLQEKIRGIPANIKLNIGLDDTFDSNTFAQAKQAFQKVNRVLALPLRQQEVQYIFGVMTQARYRELQKRSIPNLPSVGSFGLFLATLDEIVPKSFGNTGETVTQAIKRLTPKFKSLLAARIVKQMLGNTNTSKIKVTASMNIADTQKVISETFPVRGVSKDKNQSTPVKLSVTTENGIPKLPIGTQVAFELKNQESTPLYISILVIDAAGEMAVIFPNDWSVSEGAALLAAGEKRIIPTQNDGFKLSVGEPFGMTEALIIASTDPLRNSLKVLKGIAKRGGTTRGPVAPDEDEVLDVTDKLLTDLDTATRGGLNVEGVNLPAGVRGVDTNKLAAMAITFDVVRPISFS
ncbi:caspase family protein [Mastigocoleus sp. MO_188.B34]|uniref:caspase family protein n=1 Tax=Mastigocoleus sp. MO_188.B34 TaxID=3036635 RepID=UPI002626B400|nr:caspase family protein [Mastigocoleus sp. MO_188.B34]MDJ0697240.1 caspase family protein [Mastigocoleus sp. MO_188.B34]